MTAATPEFEVPDRDAPASYCPRCDRPFDSEHARALHVGEAHGHLTDAERAAYDAALEEERDELWLYHAKVVAVLGVLYAVTVVVYLVAIQSGFL